MQKQKGLIGMLQASGRMGAMQEMVKGRAGRVAKGMHERAEHKAAVKKLMSPKKGTKTFDPTC